jgi:hypothetical protein
MKTGDKPYCTKIYESDILFLSMENFKFYAVTFLLIVGAGFLGYGAISSLRDPVYYVNDQKLTTVGELNAAGGDQTATEPTTPAADTPVVPDAATSPVTESSTPAVAPETETAPSKNADLIARLQKISGTLKNGSKGDSVKAVQEALNIVAKAGLPTNGTFGNQTEAAVKKFQTNSKISPASGQVGPKTIAALVDKLK